MSAVTLIKRPLAANESFTQDIRDRFNEREPIGAVRALVYADKAGTLYLEESDDAGATWSQTTTVSVSAATTTELAWTVLTKRWYRFRYANGAAAQTKFVLVQQLRGLDLSDVTLTGGATAIAGQKTVTAAGTPELLAADQPCGEGAIIEAPETNAGNVYIFPAAGAKTDVKPLVPGDATAWPVSNLNALKIDADVSGEGVYWRGAV